MRSISIRGLSKSFDGKTVFSGLDMDFPEGGITAVLGPSGRGKTTLLRVIAGLEKQDAGSVSLPDGAFCSFAFQEHRLVPYMSIDGNMEYSLGKGGAERAAGWASELGISELGRRTPSELSGGQNQRANLVRALSSDATIVLMDEPFNSIGLGMKADLLPKMRSLLKSEGRIVVLVTHSPVDVALSADSFYLMDGDGIGAKGPYDVEAKDEARKLETEAMSREVHRLMLLMASLKAVEGS